MQSGVQAGDEELPKTVHGRVPPSFTPSTGCRSAPLELLKMPQRHHARSGDPPSPRRKTARGGDEAASVQKRGRVSVRNGWRRASRRRRRVREVVGGGLRIRPSHVWAGWATLRPHWSSAASGLFLIPPSSPHQSDTSSCTDERPPVETSCYASPVAPLCRCGCVCAADCCIDTPPDLAASRLSAIPSQKPFCTHASPPDLCLLRFSRPPFIAPPPSATLL